MDYLVAKIDAVSSFNRASGKQNTHTLVWNWNLKAVVLFRYKGLFPSKQQLFSMKFSLLANSFLKTQFINFFWHQNKLNKDGAWKFSMKFHHLLLNTNYVRVKHGTEGSNPLLQPNVANPELWTAPFVIGPIIIMIF